MHLKLVTLEQAQRAYDAREAPEFYPQATPSPGHPCASCRYRRRQVSGYTEHFVCSVPGGDCPL